MESTTVNALMFRSCRFVIAGFFGLVLSANVNGATYFIDYDNGADTHDGLAVDRAFKHSPGDSQAKENAAKIKVQAGDVIKFKGGIIYRGGITVPASGAADSPIVFDGNTAGDFGDGKAIIDGSIPVTGFVQCKSADDAAGNPNWKNIYYAPVPANTEVFTINAIQNGELLAIARTPDAADPFYTDELSTMRQVVPPAVQTYWPVKISTSKLIPNKQVPIENLVDGNSKTMAVIDPMQGAEITFTLDKEETVTKFAVRTVNRPGMPKEIVFVVDGKTVSSATCDAKPGLTEFTLEKPVTFKEVTMKVISVHEGGEKKYGALNQVQALTADGKDVLGVGDDAFSSYVDPTFFTAPNADFYKGAYLAMWIRPNLVTYLNILDYTPSEHKIRLERLKAEQYPADQGKIAILNAMGALDRQGEFYLSPDKDAQGSKRLYVWPLNTGKSGPEEITVSQVENAFEVRGKEYVTIQGFVIQKQGGETAHAVYSGTSKFLTIRDNEMRLQQSAKRDSVMAIVGGQNIRIENNYLHHNRIARGMRLTISDSVVTGNRLVKNGGTGIGFFSSKRSVMSNNTVTEHTGVHANGLTVYANSEDIIVENNKVFDSNIPFTVQDSANVKVRNNIFEQIGGVGLGIWSGWHKNLTIEHNLILGANGKPDWVAGIYTNSNKIEGLIVRNNVIAGTAGGLPGEFSGNIFVFKGSNEQVNDKLPDGSIFVGDLSELFVDPAKRDFHLKPGSPAIDAGTKTDLDKDMEGNPRLQGKAPDIGPLESKSN